MIMSRVSGEINVRMIKEVAILMRRVVLETGFAGALNRGVWGLA